MKSFPYFAALTALLMAGLLVHAQQPGRITGILPQLAYSIGEDRLGGAKMGYIDTGLLVGVADSLNGLYQLQLSQRRSAFIEKSLIRFVPDTLPARPALLGSWSVRGHDSLKVDSVVLTSNRPVLYKTWMDSYPTRIMLELYGVQANTNWITQMSTARAVKNVRYQQIDDDVILATIELKHAQPMGYDIAWSGNQLRLSIRHKPVYPSLSKMVVAIDAGHGGTNVGARGVRTGIVEKEYTLLFAKALQQLLRANGIKTIMVRTQDTTLDNKDRLQWLYAQKPDLLISFHLNSAGRPEVRGASTYYKHPAYRPLTTHILNRMLHIPGLTEFGNIGSFNFQLVQPTQFPSCLVEVAFLSNPDDEKLIRKDSFRKQVAQQVYAGIKDWVRGLN